LGTAFLNKMIRDFQSVGIIQWSAIPAQSTGSINFYKKYARSRAREGFKLDEHLASIHMRFPSQEGFYHGRLERFLSSIKNGSRVTAWEIKLGTGIGEAQIKSGMHKFSFMEKLDGEVWERRDPAMIHQPSDKTGGIDLTSTKALFIENNGQGIKFHIDPAMLKQLQNAPGFVPVIINIQPMTDLRKFLGISEAPPLNLN
jgi:hypothetical protein